MRGFARTIIVVLLLIAQVAAWADGVEFRRVALTLSEDERILLDAEIRYTLNETVSEALDNGVPLTFLTHVQMRRAGSWIWESDVVDHRLLTVLRYRPLSGLYELRDRHGKNKLSFATRDAALSALGRIVAMPIVERSELRLDQDYMVTLEVNLDIESLPLPLRPMAYLNDDWSIASEPWEWRLRP